MTAWSQTLPATDKAFEVENERGALAIKNDGTALIGTPNVAIADEAQKNFAFVQYEGKVYLYSVWANKFVQKDCSLTNSLPVDDITVEKVDGGKFFFKFDNAHNVNLGGSGQIAVNDWGTLDAGNQFDLIENGDFDSAAALAILANSYTITYNFTYGGKLVATQTTKIDKGANYPAFTALPWGAKATVPTGVPTKDETVEIVCTTDASVLPFVPADSYDDANMKWYYLQFHANDKNHLYYKESGEVLLADKTTYDENDKDAYTWAFVGNPFEGFTVYNRKAYNDNSNLKLNAASAGAVLGTADHKFTVTSSSHGTNGFYMASAQGENTQRFNKQGGKVVYWSGADAGSTFMVVERPMGPVAELQALIVEAEALLGTVNANQGTIIGKYAAETATALNSAIVAAKAIAAANITASDVETLQAAIDAVSKILPTAGKYYQIHSALGFTETKAIYSGGTNVSWKSLNNDDKSFYWQAVVKNGKTYLQNAADKKYMMGAAHNSAWTMSADAVAACAMDVIIQTEDEHMKGFQYGVVLNNWQMHAQSHSNGAGSNGNIVSWNTDAANSASSWYIVEVDFVEFFTVTYNFNYGGDTKYSYSFELAKGAAYPTLNAALPYGVTTNFAVPVGTVTENTTFNFDLTIEAELPFKTAATANDITTWYYARMHTNQPGYIGDIAEDNSINVAWGKSSDVANNNFVWGFVGDVFSGITVVNKGTGLQLTSTGSGNATLTDNGTAFFVARTTETSANATNGFCLRRNDSNNYLNANYNAGKLSHWASTDAGSTIFLTEYEEADVTVSNAGWATMYLGYSVYVPEDVNVYAVTGAANGYVTKSQIEGVIPANTGVLLENAGDYTFVKAAKDVAALEGNLLKGSVENTYVKGTAYVLANHSEAGIGFYKAELNKDKDGNDGTTHFLNNAGKAYLVLPAASETVAFYGLDWEGTTGVDEVVVENEVKTIFDITGRKVEAITAPGIYIVGGKKVLVK